MCCRQEEEDCKPRSQKKAKDEAKDLSEPKLQEDDPLSVLTAVISQVQLHFSLSFSLILWWVAAIGKMSQKMFVSCLLGANEECSARSARSETHGKDWFILEQKVPKRTRANRKGTEVCPEMFFFLMFDIQFLTNVCVFFSFFVFCSSCSPTKKCSCWCQMEPELPWEQTCQVQSPQPQEMRWQSQILQQCQTWNLPNSSSEARTTGWTQNQNLNLRY